MALVSPRRSLHTSLGILTKKFLTTAGSASKCHITHTALIRSTFLLNVEIKAHVYHYFSAGLHSVSPTCSRCGADFWRMVRYRQALTMEFLPSSHFVIPVIPKIIPFLSWHTHRQHASTYSSTHPNVWILNSYQFPLSILLLSSTVQYNRNYLFMHEKLFKDWRKLFKLYFH